jgi:hypothetical protein
MKINDTVLVAFLVSMGLFSALQAQQYVDTLSNGQKQELLSVQLAAGTATDPVDVHQIAGGTHGNDNA